MIRCQQDEVYAAEADVQRGVTFVSSRDAQAWLDAMREQWWWERFFWGAPTRTEVYWRSRGNASVGRWDKANDAGIIEMLPQHRNALIMLHELAHVISEAMHDSEAHDPYFARTYAVLVYFAIGSDAWLELKAGFDAHRVDYMQRSDSGTSTGWQFGVRPATVS